MHRFLADNRDELVARCEAKVARRPLRPATEAQLRHGVPRFLEQLRRTLEAEEEGRTGESRRISGSAGGGGTSTSEMGVDAAAHGKQLSELGFTVDQVVHCYGDLCQAITDLAVERNAPFSIEEFRTLNRCLDNAIADAVTEFSRQREIGAALLQSAAENERLGFVVHELRNSLGTATLAVKALETGGLPVGGATGSVLKRSLASLKTLVEQLIDEVRDRVADDLEDVDRPDDRYDLGDGSEAPSEPFPLAAFIADAAQGAGLDAKDRQCTLTVSPVAPDLAVAGDRERLLAALANLLQNAFKYSHPDTDVTLAARADGDRVLIEVRDHCGGLPPGMAERMFSPFTQRHDDRSGLGLGLSITRRNVEAAAGTLSVRDIPGEGCVFTIDLPRYSGVLGSRSSPPSSSA